MRETHKRQQTCHSVLEQTNKHMHARSQSQPVVRPTLKKQGASLTAKEAAWGVATSALRACCKE